MSSTHLILLPLLLLPIFSIATSGHLPIMAVQDSTQQISLAYVILFIVIGGTIVRFLFFGTPQPAAPAWTGASRNPLAVLRARDAAVERIQQMFPQVDRRTILWDLQRNGGNIQATSERILAGSIEEVSFLNFLDGLYFFFLILAYLPRIPLSSLPVFYFSC